MDELVIPPLPEGLCGARPRRWGHGQCVLLPHGRRPHSWQAPKTITTPPVVAILARVEAHEAARQS